MRNDFFSGLDVLVNSAGILMSGSVETLDIADYDKVNIQSKDYDVFTRHSHIIMPDTMDEMCPRICWLHYPILSQVMNINTRAAFLLTQVYTCK